ncbi:MAG: hypothetical protein HEQ23_14070 [Tepidisphaera sp.]
MKVTKLIAACGLCVAFGTASAQTEESTSQPSSRPANTSNGASTGNATGVGAILKQLEGSWKVDITVNTELWNPHLFKDVRSDRPSDRNDASPDQSDKKDSRTTDRASGDRLASGDGMKTFTGYTRTELILGEVLQQTTSMPDLDSTMGMGVDEMPHSKNGDHDKKDRIRDGDGDRDPSKGHSDRNSKHASGFKGVSLLSFDEGSKTYSMVFVSNCEDQMHLKNGTYTTNGNQIVFHGSHDHTFAAGAPSTSQPNERPNTNSEAKPATPTDNASANPGRGNEVVNPGNPNNPSMNPDDRTTQPSIDTARSNHATAWKSTMSGCQVVIDIISPDEHRVTMYATEGPLVPSPSNPGTPARLDSTPPDNASGINRNIQPSGNEPAIAMTAGKVVYRAVFRRAAGDEIARTRELTRLTNASTTDNR